MKNMNKILKQKEIGCKLKFCKTELQKLQKYHRIFFFFLCEIFLHCQGMNLSCCYQCSVSQDALQPAKVSRYLMSVGANQTNFCKLHVPLLWLFY